MSLEAAIEKAVAGAAGEDVSVTKVAPLIGGACQDLFRVELELGGDTRTLVLRSDAQTSLPGSLRRDAEYHVIEAAVDAGVKTPAVHWLARDLVREGAWAYFMDWIDGVTIARKLLKTRELESARQKLPDELAVELSKIHSISPQDDDLGLPVPEDPANDALEAHREALDVLPEPRPVLELALQWLQAHRPPPAPVRLCHGDFRTGNFAVTADGLAGILDWEFAHWGDPADDIGWLCVRDWRFGRLDRPIGGFAHREPFYRAYAEASGTEVDPARVRYWEIMNNVRWAVGAIHQGERYLTGGEGDLELIAIGRRAVQLEYEILRLLDKEA